MLRIYLYRRSITHGMVDPRWSTKGFARAFVAQAKGDNSPCSRKLSIETWNKILSAGYPIHAGPPLSAGGKSCLK